MSDSTLAGSNPAAHAVRVGPRGTATLRRRRAGADGFGTVMQGGPPAALRGDARIVALGEATHGTREFFELKGRAVEYLVTQLGSRCSRSRRSTPSACASTTTRCTAPATRSRR